MGRRISKAISIELNSIGTLFQRYGFACAKIDALIILIGILYDGTVYQPLVICLKIFLLSGICGLLLRCIAIIIRRSAPVFIAIINRHIQRVSYELYVLCRKG